MALKVLGPDGIRWEAVLMKRTCPPPSVRGRGGKEDERRRLRRSSREGGGQGTWDLRSQVKKDVREGLGTPDVLVAERVTVFMSGCCSSVCRGPQRGEGRRDGLKAV